jgi:hypothetical protein
MDEAHYLGLMHFQEEAIYFRKDCSLQKGWYAVVGLEVPHAI